MTRFCYWRDPLFLTICTAYLLNQWLVKPWVKTGFMSWHFNDLWLIPAALPPVLWLYRRLGLRTHDKPPCAGEIVGHWLFWSWFFEWAGPRFWDRATGDPSDVAAYACGAMFAGLWWNRARWLTLLAGRACP